MTVLIASNLLLWLMNIALLAVVLALTRQVGVLHERSAPVGALTMDHGPAVGDQAPALILPTLTGVDLQTGGASGRRQMLFFLSPSCPICKKLLPVLRSIASAERDRLDIVLASDGPPAEHKAFYARESLAPFSYVLSRDLGMTYRVAKLPYAVLINPEGRISAKGLVNNREQIESLLLADEMGVGSLQAYLAKTQPETVSATAAELDAAPSHSQVTL